MRCTQCNTEFEGNFCPSCGQRAIEEPPALPELCSRCGTSFAGRFCPNCGWAAGQPFPPSRGGTSFRTFLGAFWTVTILVFIAYLVAILVATFYLSPSVVLGILTSDCELPSGGKCAAALFVINPFSDSLFQVLLLEGQSFLIWFYVVLGLLAGLCIYLVLFHGRETARTMRLPMRRISERVRSESTIIIVAQVFVALLFFDFVYFIWFLPSIGIQPESPLQGLEDWYYAFVLVEAAFTEEIATRVLLIGLPLALGSLVVRIFQSISAPPGGNPRTIRFLSGSMKYLLGGNVDGKSPKAAQVFGVTLVLLSATIFGYLHVITWGVLWKFVDTFVGGLALGYLFLRKGIVASILLHLSVNGSAVLLIAAGGEESLVALIILGIFSLAIYALGSGFFVFYAKEVGKLIAAPFVRGPKRVTAGRPRGQVEPSEERETPFFPVFCANCGTREALYEEGVLKCSNCGARL